MGSLTAVQPQGAHPAAPNPIVNFVPMLFVVGVIYFLLIRPQQRAAKQLKNEVDALKKGDKVLTQGGLYGVVQSTQGDLVIIRSGKVSETGQSIEFELSRQAISRVITDKALSAGAAS